MNVDEGSLHRLINPLTWWLRAVMILLAITIWSTTCRDKQHAQRLDVLERDVRALRNDVKEKD